VLPERGWWGGRREADARYREHVFSALNSGQPLFYRTDLDPCSLKTFRSNLSTYWSINWKETVIISQVPRNYDYLAVHQSHKTNSTISLISSNKNTMSNIYKISKNNRIAYATIWFLHLIRVLIFLFWINIFVLYRFWPSYRSLSQETATFEGIHSIRGPCIALMTPNYISRTTP